MKCPNYNIKVSELDEKCPNCGINFDDYEAYNSIEEEKKSTFIVIFKRILVILLIISAFIFFIMEYMSLGVSSILLAVFIWVALTIEEKKIDLLQEISEKLDKNK